jgi:hypothetical protein
MAKLGRVTDPNSLDASEGSRAALRIVVPEGWLRDGAELEVTAPKKLSCDRCDGGGCDGCGRSGALLAPDEPDDRRLSLHLPGGHAEGLQLRIVDPFQDAEIEQVIVTVQPGLEASTGVVRVAATTNLAPWQPVREFRRPLTVLVVILALVVAWMLAT